MFLVDSLFPPVKAIDNLLLASNKILHIQTFAWQLQSFHSINRSNLVSPKLGNIQILFPYYDYKNVALVNVWPLPKSIDCQMANETNLLVINVFGIQRNIDPISIRANLPMQQYYDF